LQLCNLLALLLQFGCQVPRRIISHSHHNAAF
jgi:hypothetical protein